MPNPTPNQPDINTGWPPIGNPSSNMAGSHSDNQSGPLDEIRSEVTELPLGLSDSGQLDWEEFQSLLDEAARYWPNADRSADNSYFHPESKRAVRIIKDKYAFIESYVISIETYLYLNADLLEVLINTHDKLLMYFSEDCTPTLLIYTDPEEGFKRLIIRVTASIPPREAFRAKRLFFREWFSRYPLAVKELLNIDLRLL